MAKKPVAEPDSLEPFELADTPAEAPSTLDRLIGAIERMATLQAQMLAKGHEPDSQNKALMEGLTEALARVSDNQLKGAEVMAQSYRQVHRPSNEVVHGRSVFHPRGNSLLHSADSGYEKPMLKCECLVPRSEMPNDNMLTREEVELLNICTGIPGIYVIRRIDDTKVKVTVKVDLALDEVTPTKLVMMQDTAFNNEYFRLMPSLHSQLRQIIAQHTNEQVRKAGMAVLTMDEEELLIKAGKLSIAA